MPDAMTDSFLAGQGIPVESGAGRDGAGEALGAGGGAGGGAGAGEPARHADRPGEPGGRVPRRELRFVVRGARDRHHAVPLPGDRAARVGRPRASDRGRGLGAVPPAGAGTAAGLLRADRASRGTECRRPRPGGRAAAARGRAADDPVVDRRPATARRPLPRPGRRVLAIDPRLARPRRGRRGPPPGAGSGGLPVQPRRRLVRAARWRELVAQFFDPACAAEALGRIDAVQITVVRPHPGRTVRRGSPSGWRRGWPVSSAGSRRVGPG